jgi:hypothetical protein
MGKGCFENWNINTAFNPLASFVAKNGGRYIHQSQAEVINRMEEQYRLTEPKVVGDFLRSKQEVLYLDDNDIQKFSEVPGSAFFNLNKEMFTRKNDSFGLNLAATVNVTGIISALNMLRESLKDLVCLLNPRLNCRIRTKNTRWGCFRKIITREL